MVRESGIYDNRYGSFYLIKSDATGIFKSEWLQLCRILSVSNEKYLHEQLVRVMPLE